MSNPDEQDEYRPIEVPMPPLPPEGSRRQPTGYAGPPLPPPRSAPPLTEAEMAVVRRYEGQGKKLLTIEELSRQAAIASEEARRELRAAESFVPSATPPATVSRSLPAPQPVPHTQPARRSQSDCSQCGSPTNRANLNFGSRTSGYEIELTPVDQTLFDSRLSRVQVYVCEDCGYVDLYATNPKGLRPKPRRR